MSCIYYIFHLFTISLITVKMKSVISLGLKREGILNMTYNFIVLKVEYIHKLVTVLDSTVSIASINGKQRIERSDD